MSELPVISVTELVTALKEVVEAALPPCTVEGEVSNCRRSPAGHWYLTLKDAQAEVSATIWRSTADRLKFQPKDGLNVLATGSLQVYVAKGTSSFNITRLMPQGVGELELAFRQLRDKLAAEGLFDESRKRPLPRIPQRIALVTSPTGAAVCDMIQVITRRWPPARIVVVPCRVQGDGSAEDIVRALQVAQRIEEVDVIVAGRGGGSLEDLWSFNTELVARAIARSRIPVVSAVGHEIDVTIADLVADRRALTPSEAGELIVPSAAELSDSLVQTAGRLRQLLRNRLDRMRLKLAAIESRPVLQRPAAVIDQRRLMCDQLGDRAVAAVRLFVERRQRTLGSAAASMQALSPLNVLARGYSVTRSASGRIVRSAIDVAVGESLSTRCAEAVLTSTVTAVTRIGDASHEQ